MPVGEGGPLYGFAAATEDDPDLPGYAALCALALGIEAMEELASVVVGMTAGGEWCALRKSPSGYAWVVVPAGTPPPQPRIVRCSAGVVLHDPPERAMHRRAVELCTPRVDSELLGREFDLGVQLSVEISAHGVQQDDPRDHHQPP